MIARDDKWLFICSANVARSPTAEYLARRMGLLARSCGTGGRSSEHTGSFTVTPMTAEILNWADVIVCMKPGHKLAVESLASKIDKPKKIFVWRLEDDWGKPYQEGMIAVMEPLLLKTIQEYDEWIRKKAGRPVAT